MMIFFVLVLVQHIGFEIEHEVKMLRVSKF